MRARAGAHLVPIVGLRGLGDPPRVDEYRNNDVEAMLHEIDILRREARDGRISREFFMLHVNPLAQAYRIATYPLIIADGRWPNMFPSHLKFGADSEIVNDKTATEFLDSHANDRNNPEGWDKGTGFW